MKQKGTKSEPNTNTLEYVEDYAFPNGAIYTGTSHTNLKANSKMVIDMVKVHKYGLMELSTKVNGKTIRPAERESFGT